MSDALAAYLTLVVLYLIECVTWVRRDAVVFNSWWPGRFRVDHSSGLLGNAWGSIVVRCPIPFVGEAYRVQQWSVSLTKEGVIFYVPNAIGALGRPDQTAWHFTWKRLGLIEIDGSTLKAQGQKILVLSSPDAALRMAMDLEDLRDTPPEDRDRLIDELLHSSTDQEACEARWLECQSRTYLVQTMCQVLTVAWLFIVPLALLKYGAELALEPSLAALGVLTVLVSVFYFLSHRKLYPEQLVDRVLHSLMCLLYPPAACRAHLHLQLNALTAFNPLVVGRLLLQGGRRDRWTEHFARDTFHPIEPVVPEEIHAQTVMAFLARYQEHARQVLHADGIDVEELLRSTPYQVRTSPRYCIRCQTPYQLSGLRCDSCQLPTREVGESLN